MSVFIYNGVNLPYAHVSQFEQDAVGDPKSNTDRVLTKITIALQSIVNFNYLSALAPDLVKANGSPKTTNPSDIVRVITDRLLERRKALSYTFDGLSLIPSLLLNNTGTVDAKNGPTPKYCNFTQLSNTTYILNYAIEAHYWENNRIDDGSVAENKKTDAVLYNRWTETVEMDVAQYSTKTRDGVFGIRSDNAEGLTVDELRPRMGMLAIQEGFVRHSRRYTVSADGLQLEYHVTDKEVFRMPPSPAFEAEGSYTETTSKMGAYKTAEASVRLRGAKPSKGSAVTTSDLQGNLIRAAIGECYYKLQINGVRLFKKEPWSVNIVGNAVLSSTTITVGMYDNTVTVRMQAVVFPDKSPNWGLNIPAMASDGINSAAFTTPPTYTLRGPASILLQAAAYYDPDVLNHTMILNKVKSNTNPAILPPTTAEFDTNLSNARLPGQEGLLGP